MRNHRNPRYAPEGLERRLSPSAFFDSAAFSTIDTPTYPPSDPYPPTGNGRPPVLVPAEPGGPPEPTALFRHA